jgi:hypothetical protein
MTVRYTNTFRDILAFCFYHYPRSPVVLGTYGLGFLLISAVIFQSLPSDIPPAAKALSFLVLETLAFGFVAAIFTLTVVASMVSRRNKSILTEHVITLTESALCEETAYNKSETRWAGISHVARTRRYMFVYLAQYQAHVIPRRAFESDADWNSFFKTCSERMESGQQAPQAEAGRS